MSKMLHVGVLSFWTLSSSVPQIQYSKNNASQTGTYPTESFSSADKTRGRYLISLDYYTVELLSTGLRGPA